MTALLLDLDDTLVPDYADFLAAVDDVAAALGAPAGMGAAVHARARRRWRDAPESALLAMTDMSSWEALWAPFGDDLAEWADGFRLAAWREALLDSDVDDRALAGRLARAYGSHRLARCRPYPEVAAVLDGLRGSVRLGLVTAIRHRARWKARPWISRTAVRACPASYSAMAGCRTARVRSRGRIAGHGDGHDRSVVEAACRCCASGSVGVRGGGGRGKRRGASGEGEVVQRGEDHRGLPLRAGTVSMVRSASSDSLRATATRSYSGDVPAASTSPKCRYT